MSLGVRFELPFSPNRLLYLSRRHFPLLDQSSHSDRAVILYCGLVKKIQIQGARGEPSGGVLVQYVGASLSSATKQMGLFHQPVEVRHGTRSCRPLSSPLPDGAVHAPNPATARYERGIYLAP